MQLADELGIMIIDECPGVDTDFFTDALQQNHLQSIAELVHRDRNYASVIMWSISNEPRTQKPLADSYFEVIANYTREIDPSRPVTAALNQGSGVDLAGQHLDIIMFNRYNAWYSNGGRLNTITGNVATEARGWHEKHNKPVLMSEYGADTQEGLHLLPAYIWSEEYQEDLYAKHFKAFDQCRKEGFFIGEFVWNFADFKTAQSKYKDKDDAMNRLKAYTRVGGNKKGVFTRNRQPKAAAHILRKRYHSLGHELEGSPLPDDLSHYIHSNIKEEL